MPLSGPAKFVTNCPRCEADLFKNRDQMSDVPPHQRIRVGEYEMTESS